MNYLEEIKKEALIQTKLNLRHAALLEQQKMKALLISNESTSQN